MGKQMVEADVVRWTVNRTKVAEQRREGLGGCTQRVRRRYARARGSRRPYKFRVALQNLARAFACGFLIVGNRRVRWIDPVASHHELDFVGDGRGLVKS